MMEPMRFVLCLLLLVPSLGYGWGYDGHRRLARHMQDALPEASCLRQWIFANQSYAFQDDSADPDRWRTVGDPAYDSKESVRHYLEIDWVSPIESYPREWADAQAQLGIYAEGNGIVPWRSEEYYGKLVTAFQSTNNANILKTLAHFSHYVTDAFSLLHDTKNFDPNGLHLRWESDMLEVQSRIDGISSLATSSYLGTAGRAHPRHHVFDVIITGNKLLPQLLAADAAATGDAGFDMTAFYGAIKDLTARRWGDAITLYSSLVASAWVDAGSPFLVGMPAGCSMTVPQGELVLTGYALPPPYVAPDAGVVDAGSVEVDAGAPRGVDEEPMPMEILGCNCTAAEGLLAWLGLALLGLGRRARR